MCVYVCVCFYSNFVAYISSCLIMTVLKNETDFSDKIFMSMYGKNHYSIVK